MKVNVNGDASDLSAMLVSAVRYALGRRTYMVEWTCDFIADNKHLLIEKDKKVMIEDIKKQGKYGGYGADFDKEQWMRLLAILENESEDEK